MDFVYVRFTSIFTELAEGLNVETLPQYCRCTSFPVLTVHVLGLGFRTGCFSRPSLELSEISLCYGLEHIPGNLLCVFGLIPMNAGRVLLSYAVSMLHPLI